MRDVMVGVEDEFSTESLQSLTPRQPINLASQQLQSLPWPHTGRQMKMS
jgi:hypothetical protein